MIKPAFMAGILGLAGIAGVGIGYTVYEYGQDRARTVFDLVERNWAAWFEGADAQSGLRFAFETPDGEPVYVHPRSDLLVTFNQHDCIVSDVGRPFMPDQRAELIDISEARMRVLMPDGVYEDHEKDSQFLILRSVRDDPRDMRHAILLSQGGAGGGGQRSMVCEYQLERDVALMGMREGYDVGWVSLRG